MKRKVVLGLSAVIAATALIASPAAPFGTADAKSAQVVAEAAQSINGKVITKDGKYYCESIANGYLYESGVVYSFKNHYMTAKKYKKSKAAVSAKNYKKLKKAIGKATSVKNNGKGCNGGIDYIYTYSKGGTTVKVYTTDNKITAII